MYTGTQFTGSLGPGASGRWYTWGWNPASYIVWYIMPTTIKGGAPEVGWSVEVERYSSTGTTYWLTIRNLTSVTVNFEGRYAVLN
jgi:hypothetical protein